MEEDYIIFRNIEIAPSAPDNCRHLLGYIVFRGGREEERRLEGVEA